MLNWVDVCSIDDIKTEGLIGFDYEGETYVIYKSPDNEYFCTEGLCSHQKARLSKGIVDNYLIECPKHKGRFDYRTGKAVAKPSSKALNTYSTKVEKGRVYINI